MSKKGKKDKQGKKAKVREVVNPDLPVEQTDSEAPAPKRRLAAPLAEAIERLVNMVRAAAKVEKPRRATKPTRASQRRRVQRKVQHGEVKRLRGRVQGE